MRKQVEIECGIPESYWKTSDGEKIAQVMHGEGWEAVDKLNAVIAALDDGISETQDAAVVAELVKARDLMAKAKDTFWQASGILIEGSF